MQSTISFKILAIGVLTLAVSLEQTLYSQVLMTKDAALAAFFPGKNVERRTIFLNEEQQSAVRERAKVPVDSRIVTYYAASEKAGNVDAYAFLETNIVRTMPETFMVVIRSDSTVAGVEMLAFHEPADYLPGVRWFSSFLGQRLSDGLWVKRDIPNITGATLSSQAITRGVRKTMALFELVAAKENRQ